MCKKGKKKYIYHKCLKTRVSYMHNYTKLIEIKLDFKNRQKRILSSSSLRSFLNHVFFTNMAQATSERYPFWEPVPKQSAWEH